MVFSFLRRYAFVVLVCVYAAILVVLHGRHLFPRPGAHDLSRLIGRPVVAFEGRVINFPLTRWGQTRFLFEGQAIPQTALHGRAVVTLPVPLVNLSPADRIRVRGWLTAPRPGSSRSGFDEQAYWEGYEAFAMLRVWSADGFQIVKPASRWNPARAAWTFHQRFQDFWFSVLLPNEAALLMGITMGARGVLPATIKNQCIRAGVYHILVVSGQKVALIVVLGLWILRLLGVPRRWSLWISAPFIVFYALAVGADPPVVRASTMACVALAVMALGRDIPRYYPLALAAGWILLREPAALFGASFQLSFAATASLLLIMPFFDRPFFTQRSALVRWFLEAGAVGAAVHIGVWPLLIYYFHQLSLVGLVANWTLFPFSGFVMVLGLFTGTWGIVSPATVPALLIRATHTALQIIFQAIERLSAWRWAAVVLHAPSLGVCALYYLSLFGILFKIRSRTNHE